MTKYPLKLVFILSLTLFLSRAARAEDFPRYTIDARIDLPAKTITASQTVQFTNTSSKDIREVYFRVYPNRHYTIKEKKFMQRYAAFFKVNPFPNGFPAPKMDVASVLADGAAAGASIEGEDQTVLKVSLPKPLAAGESVAIKMDFSIGIPHAYGRFGWHENVVALARWYPILSVLDDAGWHNEPFYPFHRPFYSQSAHYEVNLNVPREAVVIHTGELRTEKAGEAGRKVLAIATSEPVREFALAMSPDYKLKESEWEGIKVRAYYLPGDDFYGQLALEDAQGLMAYYTKLFGPYPYREFSIAPVYLGYGGEQMPNLIFIDTRVFRLPKPLVRYFDFMISHETGHQWFYNLVGVDEFSEMWLEEGVNSYFLLEYLESKYGKDAPVVEVPHRLGGLMPNFSFRGARDTRYRMIARTRFDHPVTGKLSSFQEPSSIFSLTYGKGAGVVSMLRYLVGDEAFERIFRTLFVEYKFKNLSREEFVALCERESKLDLDWFFDEWLTTKKVCDFAVKGVAGNEIVLENKGEIEMPRQMRVSFAHTPEKIMKVERWDRKIEEVALDTSDRITGVELDPGHELLDIDRTNNVWPRRIRPKFVPLYFGVYDIPVFLPDDSYNWVTGPEIGSGGIGLKTSLQKPYDWNVYAASDYEFGESLSHSRLGAIRKNLFHSFTSAGVEVFNTQDYDSGEQDLAGGKIFLRTELWPAPYGIGDINDHVTLYLLRNRSLSGELTGEGLEDSRNLSYLEKNEAIVGTTLHFGRSGPYPDPLQGYELDTTVESSQHMLGATQFFYRSSLDGSVYQPVTTHTRIAWRLKYGWGFPDDKNLYELGGPDGLRGFDRKSVRGANALLGSVEYRFPFKEDLKWSAFDHWLGLESVGGVVFFDGGRAWYDDFSDPDFSKDAGAGLRLTVNFGSFLEKAVLRMDVAQALDRPKEETHFWVGLNQAF